MRILSIDGGGVRGLIPAVFLEELERRAGRPVSDLFDFLVGTSTGGMLALATVRPDSTGNPYYSAAELAELYRREAATIFPLQHFSAARRVVEEKYPPVGLEAALHRVFGDTPLSAARREVLVTAYDAERCRPVFLDRAQARQDPDFDLAMREAARATTAAPTYFPPFTYPTGQPSYAFLDGGLVANNPVLTAVAQAVHAGAALPDLLVASLGTGDVVRRSDFDHPHHRGVLQWATRLFTMLADGSSGGADAAAEALLGPDRYHRFQIPLVRASAQLDDARAENIAALDAEARELVARESARIDLLLEQLLAAGDRSLAG